MKYTEAGWTGGCWRAILHAAYDSHHPCNVGIGQRCPLRFSRFGKPGCATAPTSRAAKEAHALGYVAFVVIQGLDTTSYNVIPDATFAGAVGVPSFSP
jgi:hypothetical protein